MKPSRSPIAILAIAALVIVAMLYFSLFRAPAETTAEADFSSAAAEREDEALASDAAGGAPLPPESDLESLFADKPYETERITLDLSKERPSVAESRQMYQAHASLRAPAIDDPDSPANVEIKQRSLNNVLQLAQRHQAEKAAQVSEQ